MVGSWENRRSLPSGARVHQPTVRAGCRAAGGLVAMGLALTAIDEALIGVLRLGLALVPIAGASKAEYGVFSLVS